MAVQVFVAAMVMLVDASVSLAQGIPEVAGVAPSSTADMRQWDSRIDQWIRRGALRVRGTWTDPLLDSVTHQRLDYYHRGVRVHGADLTRQLRDRSAVSIFGALYADIDIETSPAVSTREAATVIEAAAGLAPRVPPELVVLATDGGYALAYLGRVFTGTDLLVYCIDAQSGAVIERVSDLMTQAAIGVGTGVLADEKKISATATGGAFLTRDELRPPDLSTFDMRGNLGRTLDALTGFVDLSDADLAMDTDNVWQDGATVDAHVHSGWTYDFLFKRFGRRGLDGRDARIMSLVHPVNRADIVAAPADILGLFYVNAFYCHQCGADGNGMLVYGEGLPPGITLAGTSVTFFSAGLDVVAHELTHGVTAFSSGLLTRNVPGALNEAFSDIMAVSVEFFYHEPGNGPRQADYLVGEDVFSRPLRSLADPRATGNPDHLSRRFEGTADNGGIHLNSTIASHAFYLAIEGGRNRTSGRTVEGVGAVNRAQIEDVFYRAFVFMLPANADFSLARDATVQAARDLHGAGSAVEAAIRQAWDAVGVLE